METQKKGRMCEKIDRFSDLPEGIIYEILSFLDIKEAIKTCVLSKRWKTIWNSLPDVSFDDPVPYNTSFTKFVDKVLSTRDDSCRVRKLQFSSHCSLEESLFYKVINYAVSHHVQSLVLPHCSSCKVLHFPPALSMCKSLRILKLSGFKFESSDFGLTNLTSLSLYWCSFSCQGDLCDPFARCPNLKNLLVKTCVFYDIKIFKISGPQLLNLQFTRNEPGACYKVEIAAPKLESFIIEQCTNAVDFSKLDLPSLNHTDVYYSSRKKALRDSLYLINLFQGLYNAQTVKLYSETIEALNLDPGLLEQQPPPFKRLQSLKVKYPAYKHSFSIPTSVMTYLLGGTPHSDSIHVDCRMESYPWKIS